MNILRDTLMYVVILLIGLLLTPALSQVTVTEDSLFSPSLQRMTAYYAVLPDGYSKTQERYPVLYLLHGFAGDYTNWVKLSNLVRYAKEHRIIIITPDGKNSWYANSFTAPNARYEDFISVDLIDHVEKKYRVIQSKFNRGIAGLSMGGYGALKAGLKYPLKYCFAAGISPSIQFPFGLEDSVIVARRSKETIISVRSAFGETRRPEWFEYDIPALTEKAFVKSLPYFYLSAGSQDGIPEVIEQTHILAAQFRKKGISFEMHESPGGHDWKFWDKEIETVLIRMSQITGRQK